MIYFGENKENKVLRDSLGKTYCGGCGKVLSFKEENYSQENYKKLLCFLCQKKEPKEGYASVKDWQESEGK